MRKDIRYITSLKKEDLEKILSVDDIESGEGISASVKDGKLKIAIDRKSLGTLIWRYIESNATTAINTVDINDAMKAIDRKSY